MATEAVGRRRAVDVLVASVDGTFSALVRVNLERRGLLVHQAAWAACCGPRPWLPSDADAVVADLDCPAPGCWAAVPHLRAAFPQRPVLLLAHDGPGAARSCACEPCRYLRKPVAVGDLVRVLFDLLAGGAQGGDAR